MLQVTTDAGLPTPRRVRLDGYREAFRTVVLRHMRRELPFHEWENLRTSAGAARALALSHEQLTEIAISEDGLSVAEVLAVPHYRRAATVIGQIDGQAVHYVVGRGIYLWGLNPANGYSLSLWITYPAYPPGW